MANLSTDKLVDKIIKYKEFLNQHGYIVTKGRSSSPQLKKAKK